MGKLTKYVIMMSGLTLLFYFTGLLNQTPNTTLLNLLLDPVSLENSTLALKGVVAIEAIVASLIVVGFAAAGNVELGVMSAFAIFLFNLFWDFMAVVAIVSSANLVFGILLFAPLMLLFTVTILEWWRAINL